VTFFSPARHFTDEPSTRTVFDFDVHADTVEDELTPTATPPAVAETATIAATAKTRRTPMTLPSRSR
jgi:hypothetical protein